MKKHKIDSLFQSKLGKSECTPSPDAWSKLEAQLKKNKKKRLFIKLSIAASLLLLVTLGWIFTTQQFAENKQNYIPDNTQKPNQSQNTVANKKSPFTDSVNNNPIDKTIIKKSNNDFNINKENILIKKKKNNQKNLQKDYSISNKLSTITTNNTIEINKKNNKPINKNIDNDHINNFSKINNKNLAKSDRADVKIKKSLKIVYILKPAKSSNTPQKPTKTASIDSTKTTEPSTKRTFKKVLAFAKNIKNNPSGFASLSEAKKKLFALTKKNKINEQR